MDSQYWDIAAKQLAGNATLAEQEKLIRWRNANPENEAYYQAQKLLWQATAPAVYPEVDTEAAWQKVRSRLTYKEQTSPAKVIPLYSRLLRVAAAVTLLIGMAWLAQYLIFPYMGMQVVESGNRSISVILPDSSEVWLNKNSKLAYDPSFDGNIREVKLEGEAFFEVKRDTQRPFIIQTKRTQTRVLGTSFNLRDISSEKTAQLAVATGKVAFTTSDGKAEKKIEAGYKAVLYNKDHSIETMPLQNKNAWAWKSGKLIFNSQPLALVIHDLERYYGVRLQLKGSNLSSCRYTGSFQDAELAEVLQVLGATIQLEYLTQDKHTYTLTGKGCQ